MKNQIATLLLTLIMHQVSHAQITLTQTSYPSSVIGTDSLKKTTYNSSFPSLSATTAGMWDMNVVTDTTPVFYSYRVAAPSYQYADSNYYSLSSYFKYQGNVESNVTSSGLFQYGISTPYVAYSLTAITISLTDSLIIPSQFASYTSPLTKIAFPATSGSYWNSAFSSDFNFQISFSPLYDHAPGIIRRFVVEKDSVIGWGKMSVKDALGNPSSYFNVLQVQTIVSTIDSVFINGSPASVLVLGPLGLTQGKKDTTYLQNYYREQEVTPLAQVKFKNSSYTQPVSATTHVQRMQQASVPTVSGAEKVVVYPNPAVGAAITVQLPPVSGAWGYQISDLTGYTLVTNKLQVTSGKANINLPLELSNGVYGLKILYNGLPYCVRKIEILR